MAGEAEEEIQRALYVGNYSAAVDAALQVPFVGFETSPYHPHIDNFRFMHQDR
jgi:hypothetical protein